MIAQAIERRAALESQRAGIRDEQHALLRALPAGGSLSETDQARYDELSTQSRGLVPQIDAANERVGHLEQELRDDERLQANTLQRTPAAPAPAGGTQSVRVGAEPRTYQRENDPRGIQFTLDVARQFLRNDQGANERLQRHMQEEFVERANAGRPLQEREERAAGTGAFSGLVVPQYLVDQYAPLARAGRPAADAMRHHDLPAQGMVVNIGKVTTGTSVDDQSAENDTVEEEDIDDTLMSINVATAAGSQTVSRQAVERGVGVEDTTVEDLIRAYAVNLDGKVLNRATTGLTNVATAITYTSAAPTGTEAYPKLIHGAAAVEAALLDQGLGDTILLMHSNRWYWFQSQMVATWPLFGQPNIPVQQGGVNYAERYGNGFRGLLPNGTPVIVDNNIATNLGADTNQDEIYAIAQSESHLWEDPAAPMLIRAEQPSAKKLGIDLVVYGYYAFTFTRRAHAQKITGTGLVAPTF